MMLSYFFLMENPTILSVSWRLGQLTSHH